MNDRELKKVIHDSIRKLRSVSDMYRVRERVDRDLINVLSSTRKEVINIKGKGDEESKSSKLKRIGLGLLSLPIDPTQITTATGATLYLIGKVLGRIEEKTKGIKDVIVYYNKFITKIKELLS